MRGQGDFERPPYAADRQVLFLFWGCSKFLLRGGLGGSFYSVLQENNFTGSPGISLILVRFSEVQVHAVLPIKKGVKITDCK